MSAPNPYAPPQAAVRDTPPGAGSAIKAVTLGLLADIGGTFAASVVLMVVYGIVRGVSGASVEEISAADLTSTDSWLFHVGGAGGLAFSVLGGYVCARIAKRNEIKLGAVTAIISAAIGLLLAADQYQLGTNLSMTLAAIIAVMVGARLGYWKNRGAK